MERPSTFRAGRGGWRSTWRVGGTMPSSRLRGDAAGASVLRARGPGGGRKHVAPHPRSSSDRHTNKKESAAESFNTEHKSGPRVPSLSIRTRPGPPRAVLQAVMLMAHGTWERESSRAKSRAAALKARPTRPSTRSLLCPTMQSASLCSLCCARREPRHSLSPGNPVCTSRARVNSAPGPK